MAVPSSKTPPHQHRLVIWTLPQSSPPCLRPRPLPSTLQYDTPGSISPSTFRNRLSVPFSRYKHNRRSTYLPTDLRFRLVWQRTQAHSNFIRGIVVDTSLAAPPFLASLVLCLWVSSPRGGFIFCLRFSSVSPDSTHTKTRNSCATTKLGRAYFIIRTSCRSLHSLQSPRPPPPGRSLDPRSFSSGKLNISSFPNP